MTEKNLIYPNGYAASPIYGKQIKIFAGNELEDSMEEARYLRALAQTDTGTIYHLPYLRYYFLGNQIVYQDSNVMLSIPPEYHYLRPFLVENSLPGEDSAPNIKLRFCNKYGAPLEVAHFREVHTFIPREIKTGTTPSCTNLEYLKTHTSILQDVTSAIDNATNSPAATYAEGLIYKLMHDDHDSSSHEKSVYIYDISHQENQENLAVPLSKVGKLFNEGMVFKMCKDGFSLIHLRSDMYVDDSPLRPSESIHINWKEVLQDPEQALDIINSSLENYPIYLLINDRQTSLSKDLSPGVTLVEEASSAIALLKQVKLLATEGSDASQHILPGEYAIPIHVGNALENAVSSDSEGISAREITAILKESEISLSPSEERRVIPIFLDETQQFMYAPCIIEKTGDNNLRILCDTANAVSEPVSYSSELLRSFTKKNFPYYMSKTPSYTHIEEGAVETSLPQETAAILAEEDTWEEEDDELDEDQWEIGGDYIQLWSAPVYVESVDVGSTGVALHEGYTTLLRKTRDVHTEATSTQPAGSVFIGKAIQLPMDVLQNTQDVLYYAGIALKNGMKKEISPYGYYFVDELLLCKGTDGNTVEIPPKYQFLKAVPTRLNTGDIQYKFVFSDKNGALITPSELETTDYIQQLDGKLPESLSDVMPYVSDHIPNLTSAENSGPVFSIIKKGYLALLADNDGKEVGRLENNPMFLRIHRDSTNTPQVFLQLDDEAISIPLKPAKPTQAYSSAYLYLSPSGLFLHVGQKMLPKSILNATRVKSDENLQNFVSSLEDFLLHRKLPSEGATVVKLSLQQMPDSPNLWETKAMLRKNTYRDLEVANGKLLVQKASHILVHVAPDQEPRILCSHVSDLSPSYVPRVDPHHTESEDSIITLKKGIALLVRNSTLLSELRNIPTHYTLQHRSEHEIPPVEHVAIDSADSDTKPKTVVSDPNEKSKAALQHTGQDTKPADNRNLNLNVDSTKSDDNLKSEGITNHKPERKPVTQGQNLAVVTESAVNPKSDPEGKNPAVVQKSATNPAPAPETSVPQPTEKPPIVTTDSAMTVSEHKLGDDASSTQEPTALTPDPTSQDDAPPVKGETHSDAEVSAETETLLPEPGTTGNTNQKP
ncbi:hypothetical protein, partial [Anaplasma bovis]|uniref:hypothetical protein n=1 Tax=Anaplasma bovis TaxID=186733 RepID=UPI002FF1E08C